MAKAQVAVKGKSVKPVKTAVSIDSCWLSTFKGVNMCLASPYKAVFSTSVILAVLDLKDGSVEYVLPRSLSDCAAHQLVCGHYRFPIVAIAEAKLCPRIFVFTLHDNPALFCTFQTTNVATFLDLKFTEHDLLVGLSSGPYYSLYFWNYRHGTLVFELNTMVSSYFKSLIVTNQLFPTVYIYSIWNNSISAFDMWHREKSIEVVETSEFVLPKEYENVDVECFATMDDGNLYVINEYGVISLVDNKQYRTTVVWEVPDRVAESQKHKLFNGRNSLIVHSPDRLVAARKRQGAFFLDWILDLKGLNFASLVMTLEQEIFICDDIGNTYKIKPGESQYDLGKFMQKQNVFVKDMLVPKFIKEETILLLTHNDVRLFDLGTMQDMAVQPIKEVTAAHSLITIPIVALATRDGFVYIYSYEKGSEFQLLGSVEVGVVARRLSIADNLLIVEDKNIDFYFIYMDFKNNLFGMYASIVDEFKGNLFKVCSFLIDSEHFAVFVGSNEGEELTIISELRVFEFKPHSLQYKKHTYNLPGKYINFYCGGNYQRVGTELFGVQLLSTTIDLFYYQPNGGLKWDSSLKTHHVSSILFLNFNKNLLSWSADGAIVNFRNHRVSSKPYRAAKRILLKFQQMDLLKSYEMYNFKYFIQLKKSGLFHAQAVTISIDNPQMNEELPIEVPIIMPHKHEVRYFKTIDDSAEVELCFTEEDLLMVDSVRRDLATLGDEVRELIEYDMGVTGKTAGIFSKFCLNNIWLGALNEQARLLCQLERESLMAYTQDQERIRDWIRNFIFRYADHIGYKIHAINSNITCLRYVNRRTGDNHDDEYDFVRFYNLDKESDDENEEEQAAVKSDESSEEEVKVQKKPESLNPYVVPPGVKVYDHMMSPAFALQDVKCVTVNLFYYHDIMFKVKLKSALKNEFNHLFDEVRQFKENNIDSVNVNNNALKKIYDNMNIMLRLLGMETFEPPPLVSPTWEYDEIPERILEVDDSEVKAINRRKKKAVEAAKKEGRLLLWSVEFWSRALMQMMDGVLEKLWEEEIKKDIPMPEFTTKKQPHEYTVEDQRQWKEYEEKVRILESDRRKYLRILKEMEQKALKQKAQNIMKINERVTLACIEKLKYNFALRCGVLRIMNCSTAHLHRIHSRKEIDHMMTACLRIHEFKEKCSSMLQVWEAAVNEMKQHVEQALAKDRQVEKQFRSNFLSNLPSMAANEFVKLYRKRPKVNLKMFNNPMIAIEVAHRLVSKTDESAFPLPKEFLDFLEAYHALDRRSISPNQIDTKQWDTFCRIRKSKTETELRLKAAQAQLAETLALNASVKNDLEGLHAQEAYTIEKINQLVLTLLLNIQNMNLQVTLSSGQVEVQFGGIIENLDNAILMNVDDINYVNDLIMKAGNIKLRVMHRVAAFRRQVIFREWEHKVFCANIAYLKYMLQVIEKSKVSKEFLDILRKWDKIRDQRDFMMKVGIIEAVVQQKLDAYRLNLERVIEKIAQIREKIAETKEKNRRLSRKIELVKVDVTFANLKRDELLEEKHQVDLKERIEKIRIHHQLMMNVRKDYARILELNTILELQRLRTFPTLDPAPPACPPPKGFC